MKKMILALVLLASCNTPANVQPPVAIPTPVPTETLQTYTYLPYNFEFKYPKDFVFGAPQYGALEEKIVELTIPNTAYQGTNFGDASFTVSATYPEKSEDCFNPIIQRVSDGGEALFNDIQYTTWTETGAAAGNLYVEKVYRTMHDKFCFELRETMHTSNIGNYDPGTVTEIDEKPLWEKLDAVVSSFKFTQQK